MDGSPKSESGMSTALKANHFARMSIGELPEAPWAAPKATEMINVKQVRTTKSGRRIQSS